MPRKFIVPVLVEIVCLSAFTDFIFFVPSFCANLVYGAKKFPLPKEVINQIKYAGERRETQGKARTRRI